MKRYQLYLFNFWPPFLGAGIHIDRIAPDLRSVRVRLKKRPWTANIIGTQYGGSIYSMTDPFYMTLLMIALGRGYRVLDKAATVEYLRLGKTELRAEFAITDETLDAIRAETAKNGKMEWKALVEIKDTADVVVAKVEKTIWIRKLEEEAAHG